MIKRSTLLSIALIAQIDLLLLKYALRSIQIINQREYRNGNQGDTTKIICKGN